MEAIFSKIERSGVFHRPEFSGAARIRARDELIQSIGIVAAPSIQKFDGLDEPAAKIGEAIFDHRRYRTVHMPGQQAASLHVPHGLGQHLLGDPRQAAQKHASARSSAVTRVESMEDHAGPFRCKKLQHAARRAILPPFIVRRSGLHVVTFWCLGQ